ncbi:hypothetical protein [Rhizobium phage RHph_X2_26]|nr:hypothetical protein [Rhizobium phage RHph_X2_26]
MILAKLKGYLAAAGVILAAIIGATLYGYRNGVQSERNKRVATNAKALDKARRVEHEISGLNGSELDARLAEWMRDKR